LTTKVGFQSMLTIDETCSGDKGWTALILATQHGQVEAVGTLIAKGANVNHIYSPNQWTALLLASFKDHVDIVELLLEKGAEIDHADKFGQTALILASKNGHSEVVKILLQRKARTDKRDQSRRLALDWVSIIPINALMHQVIINYEC